MMPLRSRDITRAARSLPACPFDRWVASSQAYQTFRLPCPGNFLQGSHPQKEYALSPAICCCNGCCIEENPLQRIMSSISQRPWLCCMQNDRGCPQAQQRTQG